MAEPASAAQDLESVVCPRCELLCAPPAGKRVRCPRCAARFGRRKPDSIQRTWALVIAAALLYIPANYYPILTVTILGEGEADKAVVVITMFAASRFDPRLIWDAAGHNEG